MRNKLLSLLILMGVGTIYADNLTVESVVIPKGGQGTIIVNYQFDASDQYSGWQFSLRLPNEVITVKNAKGNSQFTAGTCHDESYTITSNYSEGLDNYVALSLESSPISGIGGLLISIPIEATSEYEVGTCFQASLENIQFGNKDGIHTTFFDDINFSINIGMPAETRTILDEASTTIPEAATNINIKVIRTINANEWSTICLPFSMTEAQVKATFGDDVQLGNFYDTESTYDDDDNVVSLSISFEDATEIEANHPYIIKVSSPITEFTVDNVNIEPLEDDAMVEVDNGLTGRRRVVYGGFYGTYHAQTKLEEYALFLSSNKFWYSKGLTKMKAFRAYFVLLDVLTEVEAANTRISINFSDEEVNGIKTLNKLDNGCFYDLQGRKVLKPVKGLYIINGRKEVIK